MLSWPPKPRLPFVRSRWYDSQTLGCYDTVGGVTVNPAPGSATTGIFLAPFKQWANSRVTFNSMGADLSSGASPVNVRFAIYSDSNGTPQRLLGKTATVVIPASSTVLVDEPLGSPLILEPGNYWLAFLSETRIQTRGWASGTGSTREEGFNITGFDNPLSTGQLIKLWFWLVDQPPASVWTDFPDLLVNLPTGSQLKLEDQSPRITIKAA